MSRPFSYNDENFTVIDNLLFIHFRDDNARSKMNQFYKSLPVFMSV